MVHESRCRPAAAIRSAASSLTTSSPVVSQLSSTTARTSARVQQPRRAAGTNARKEQRRSLSSSRRSMRPYLGHGYWIGAHNDYGLRKKIVIASTPDGGKPSELAKPDAFWTADYEDSGIPRRQDLLGWEATVKVRYQRKPRRQLQLERRSPALHSGVVKDPGHQPDPAT